MQEVGNPMKNQARNKPRRDKRMFFYRGLALILAALMVLGGLGTVLYFILL
jgi:hypothetical protein